MPDSLKLAPSACRTVLAGRVVRLADSNVLAVQAATTEADAQIAPRTATIRNIP